MLISHDINMLLYFVMFVIFRILTFVALLCYIHIYVYIYIYIYMLLQSFIIYAFCTMLYTNKTFDLTYLSVSFSTFTITIHLFILMYDIDRIIVKFQQILVKCTQCRTLQCTLWKKTSVLGLQSQV